ncbi:site-specific integrase [Flavobacterium sp.]|uniref:site-specific integrase n=1 Tax=Flavobacterium sp. TaxID=239 RepID=UPI002FDEC18E
MANVKMLLDTRRAKSDGNFNVIFRITHIKKVYTINSGITVLKKHWNEQNNEIDKSHPNSKLVNLKLSKEYFKVQQGILKLEDSFSIEALRSIMEGKPVTTDTATFKVFSERLIAQMYEVNRIGNAIVYQTALNRFLQFCEKPDITFSEIDYSLLQRFSHYLTLEGLKQNSISNYFRSLRAIYNKAIKEKLVNRSLYPFNDMKIKTEKTIKRAILKEDIAKLIKTKPGNDSPSERALNHFLLSFYLIGISFTDLAYLKHENLVEGRMVYRRRKTGKNYSVKVFPQTEVILSRYNICNNNYLLPILSDDIPENSLKAKRVIMQWIKTTNKYLKRLSKDAGVKGTVTTYTARHTFATTAKKLGYSNELIAEALGHEYGNRITNIYLDSFDREVVDEMHKNVILSLEQ